MNVTDQPEYQIWAQMRQRCNNPSHKKYKSYGGRGISVCDRWNQSDSYPFFIQDMGPRPSDEHSIDRINNDGIYEPSNCRWAISEEQAYNKTNNFNIKVGDIYGKLSFTGNKRYKERNHNPNAKRWELEFKCGCGNIKWYRLDKLKQINYPTCGSKECKCNGLSKPK